MSNPSTNIRKAAVFIRSLDGKTAATMLAQLSPEEAEALRQAIRALGPLDAEEQADVLAELRSAGSVAKQPSALGVELKLSGSEPVNASTEKSIHPLGDLPAVQRGKRFEFLERAPIDALVPYLAREHAQTIAVVLSHLPPDRAAALLSRLPARLQADSLERLTTLGEADPESVVVLENELAAWLAERAVGRPGSALRNDAVASILAAADNSSRDGIIANLRVHKSALADQLAPVLTAKARRTVGFAEVSHQAARCAARMAGIDREQAARVEQRLEARQTSAQPNLPVRTRQLDPRPRSTIPYDSLVHLDNDTLSAALRELDPALLVLALAGSKAELVEHVCRQLPKRAARTLRRHLRQLGPTRLSDVEAAQLAVAQVAANVLDRAARQLPATAA
jgi:flagellar motor switch protein FliG